MSSIRPASIPCRRPADSAVFFHEAAQGRGQAAEAKFLKKAAHRGFDYRSFDRWLDWEFAKSAIPILPWMIVSQLEGQTAAATAFLIVGAPLALIWFGFVLWNFLAMAVRLQDKRYMLVTRKQLSKEYRQ